MIISIASGKGGTGKTTVAVNLALYLASKSNVALIDLDVEEPNDNSFLQCKMNFHNDVNILRPSIDENKCSHCGVCAKLCEFNALAVLPNQVMVFSELCHGCGLCAMACPNKAIEEEPHKLGIIEKYQGNFETNQNLKIDHFTFYQGILEVGEAIATPIIHELKKIALSRTYDHVILDLPPGSACPVIEALSETDYAVLVTEPTPAGEHDLKIAIEVVKQLKIPFGIVNNRSDIGDDRILRLASEENYQLLIEIPHLDEVISKYSEGEILVGSIPEYEEIIAKLWERIPEDN